MSNLSSPPDLGRALSAILSGSWRLDVAPFSATEGESRHESSHKTAPDEARLRELIPVLTGAGVGALAWRRLRGTRLESAARELQILHFKQALDARLQEKEIARVIEVLRARGVEVLLVKGAATARFYPESGLRAVGDIDLLIRPENQLEAAAALGAGGPFSHHVDWKTEVPAVYRISGGALFERQQRVQIGEIEVGVPCAEDGLRISCLHFLKHGAWRPLWLCDIAAALENRPADFSWECCLGEDRRSADFIACALGAAHQLLGASVENTPIEARAENLPRWFLPAITRAWQRPHVAAHPHRAPLSFALRGRHTLGNSLRERWPDPLEAAIERQFPLDLPPLLIQSASFAARGAGFLRRNRR